MKTFCVVHHFNYSGIKCPFCEEERIKHLVHKFEKKNNLIKENTKSTEITQADIERLKTKFNKR